jgi:gas vesicle protein
MYSRFRLLSSLVQMFACRYSHLVTHETTLKTSAESRETTLKLELHAAQETINRHAHTIQTLTEQLHQSQSVHSHEKQALTHTYESRLASLVDENNALQRASTHALNNKVAEMNEKLHQTVADMEANIHTRVHKEFEGEKARELLVMSKKCSRDVELVRSEERRQAAVEVGFGCVCQS